MLHAKEMGGRMHAPRTAEITAIIRKVINEFVPRKPAVIWGILMLKRLVATLFATALVGAGLAPAAVADASGCTRNGEFEAISYTCSGQNIDLSQVPTDATKLRTSGHVQDWTALGNLTSLKSLSIEGAMNDDVAAIHNAAPSVDGISLEGPAITDLSPLSAPAMSCSDSKPCVSGIKLVIPGVKDISPLSNLNSGGCLPVDCVRFLTIDAPAVTDFSPLGSIQNLSSLTVSASSDAREQHVILSAFPLPNYKGLNGSQLMAAHDPGWPYPQHTLQGSTARATYYAEGWVDYFVWPLAQSTGSTTLETYGTKVEASVSRTYTVTKPARGDFNGDGRSDLLAKDSTGVLWLYHGTNKATLPTRTRLGAGWNSMTMIASPGDFNGDSRADVLARDTAGVLWLYPGNGKSGWGTRVRLGAGWNVMTALVGAGDSNADGKVDLLARDSAGVLWRYPGNGKGALLPRIRIGAGWNTMNSIVGGDSMGIDHIADVIARDSTGTLWFYRGNGQGGFLPRSRLYTGWKGMTAIASPGDLGGDEDSDLLARDASGVLWLYRNPGLPAVRIGGGWAGMKAIV
ncbi:VCBS repeat-containing protein [Arthrobacter globiformis]|uniref:VCBS repeat-containing protein n=1 Tax=Arthrobacter globiformis TaxID=1665 RepID=UPI0027D7908D|nr:VCBS repeat-containing protein [Arthrobacter globiformis]